MVGYLVLENGIFILGLALLEAMPFLVEIGVLLDLFVGIFVMGIIINHINREFASLDTRAPERAQGMTMAPRARPGPARPGAASRSSCRRSGCGPWLVPLGGAAHLVLVGAGAARGRRCRRSGEWLVLDSLGKLVLGFVSLLFFLCSLYAPGYLALRPERDNRIFCACLLAFLAMMSLITESHHLGLMWVALEATTLASAPLIYFNRNAALARSHLEVPAHRLGRHRAGAARLLLPRLQRAARRARSTSLLFDDLVRDAPAPVAAVAARGLRPPVRRLRHQDGPGADAHLEARRLRRGARASSARCSPAA